jgi:hypothetical protein
MIFAMLPIALLALAGVGFAWFLLFRELREAKVMGWRQAIALAGAAAATLQIPIPFLMAVFFIDPHNQKNLALFSWLEVLFFVIALPSAFRWKGLLRWGLVLTSLFFLVLTGAIYATSQWQF